MADSKSLFCFLTLFLIPDRDLFSNQFKSVTKLPEQGASSRILSNFIPRFAALAASILYVKVFEIVNGAKIKGKAPPDTMLALYLPIVSNQGREYTILKQTQSDAEGNYEFIVSISQDGPYGVRPTDLYTITDGVSTWQAAVSEQDVLNGGEVVVDIV